MVAAAHFHHMFKTIMIAIVLHYTEEDLYTYVLQRDN